MGKAVAARTAEAATDAGALVAIVTGDAGVAQWARSRGYLTISELHDQGLDGAATAAVAEAMRRQRPWAVIHADLPLVTPGVLRTVFAAATESTVLVPSYDGGTNLIGGTDSGFRFRYGPGSFHRHLADHPRARVVTDPRLALDLDTAGDLSRIVTHQNGEWLRRYLH